MQLVNVKSFGSLRLIGLLLPTQGAQSDATPAKGPLRIHPHNPRYEWFNSAKGVSAGSGNIQSAGGAHQFTAPFPEDAVLYLRTTKAE